MTINGETHPVFKNSTSPRNFFTYDPMRDYALWFTGREFSSISPCLISHTEIREKLWEHHQLHEWLNANMKSYVLVQNTSSGWNLQFTHLDDFGLFYTWWPDKKKEYLVVIRADPVGSMSLYQREDDVKKWCNTMLKNRWETYRRHDRIDLYVVDGEEAVMAKLALDGGSE